MENERKRKMGFSISTITFGALNLLVAGLCICNIIDYIDSPTSAGPFKKPSSSGPLTEQTRQKRRGPRRPTSCVLLLPKKRTSLPPLLEPYFSLCRSQSSIPSSTSSTSTSSYHILSIFLPQPFRRNGCSWTSCQTFNCSFCTS